jgi:glutamine amidotransferase
VIAIIDYGVGNLFSLKSSLKYLKLDCIVTNKMEDLVKADRIILPGVGAFPDAITKLQNSGLIDTIKAEVAKGKPLLGICLGMQLLFDKSYEYGEYDGLGLISGEICDLQKDIPSNLKVPHMGWNSLKFIGNDSLFKYIKEDSYVYFVHSFYAKNCEADTICYADYGVKVTAGVRKGNVMGTQFHPEKSGETGLNILRAFSEI